MEFDIEQYQRRLEERDLTSQEKLQMHHVRTQFTELAMSDDDFSFDKRRRDFARGLQTVYPDFSNFLLYHVLIGSTPRNFCRYFDFPAEHSVIGFFKREREEHCPVLS